MKKILIFDKNRKMRKNDIFLNPKIGLKEKGLILVISDYISKNGTLEKIDDLLSYIGEGRNSLLNSFRVLKTSGIIKREKYKEDNKNRYYYILNTKLIKSYSLDNFINVDKNKEEDKTEEKKKTTIKEKTFKFFEDNIFDYRNEQDILIHKKATKSMFNFYLRLLEDGLEVEDIKKGIETYSVVYKNPNTFWKYRWGLTEFLQRKNGCRVFCDKTLEDYLPNNTGNFTNTKTPYLDNRGNENDYGF